MRNLLQSAALITTCLAAPAVAENSIVVVELYTSQGCSSCPPADAMLKELSTRDDVIAMALHVDYWDYIGWVDEFANPDHTRRQQSYARAAGQTTVYTPQFVVGGQDLVIGARGMQLADAIQAHTEVTLPVAVSLKRDGASLTISAELDDTTATGPFVIQLVRMLSEQTVSISRGENAGQTISYSNVVSGFDILQQWDGTSPVELQADVGEAEQIAVVIQRGADGPVVGAAKLN